MFRQLEEYSFIFRLLIGGLIIVFGIFLIPLLINFSKSNVYAQPASLPYDTYNSFDSGSPNAITTGFESIGNEVKLTALQIKDGSQKSTRALQISTTNTGKEIAMYSYRFNQKAANNIINGISTVGTSTFKGIGIVASLPGNAVDSVTKVSFVNNTLRPSDHQDIPIIDPNSPELLAALTALPPIKPAAQTSTIKNTQNINDGPQWPIKGNITTKFGVYHRPYQSTHTGLDISDYKKPGTTPILPFRSGKVIEVINSRHGYGNHIIIDHGNNVTSVYAHLAKIYIKKDQLVLLNTVLGTEGSTGLSTGTHLHFEIRVNGKVADPHKFILGQP